MKHIQPKYISGKDFASKATIRSCYRWCDENKCHYLQNLDLGTVDGKKVYFVEKRLVVIGEKVSDLLQSNSFSTIKVAREFLQGVYSD